MSPIDNHALSLLRAALSSYATISLPGEPGYSIKRWAANAERQAALVACPATPQDVVHILAFVQGRTPYESQEKLDVAVKCGGHNASGASSSDGGVVIDLQPNMHAVRVDPEEKLAYVGGGALIGPLDEAVQKHGLAAAVGVVSQTGIGRLTLGGGIGWLSGQHGLVIDNLVAATLVTSRGDIVSTSEDENPELLWALRGGGGNFGVVTEFVFKLYDQRPDLYHACLTFSPSALPSVADEINAWLADRCILETGLLLFVNDPTKQPILLMHLLYNGEAKEGESKFARFEKLKPHSYETQVIKYTDMNRLTDAAASPGDSRIRRGHFVPVTSAGIPFDLMRTTFDTWHQLTQEHPAATKSIMMWEFYSAEKWSKVPSNATAYVHRNPTYNVNNIVRWSDPAFTPGALPVAKAIDMAFTQARSNHFAPHLLVGGGYANYLDIESQNTSSNMLHKRFGSNYERLVQVKTKYDPDNLFCKWFGIPPNTSAEAS
ncbi:FAD-binding domain protein [Ceratobasidium sp. AG-Ba]|nr:FAD-binding domain protein [Ceratobasidium sp. AG-Ba]